MGVLTDAYMLLDQADLLRGFAADRAALAGHRRGVDPDAAKRLTQTASDLEVHAEALRRAGALLTARAAGRPADDELDADAVIAAWAALRAAQTSLREAQGPHASREMRTWAAWAQATPRP